MKGRNQAPLGIGFESEKPLHQRAPPGLPMIIKGLTDHVEVEDTALQNAVTDNFPKSLFPCPVEGICGRWRAIADVSEKHWSVGLGIHQICRQWVEVGESLIGAICFYGSGQIVRRMGIDP